MAKEQYFVIIKDSKENFRINPKYWLINPCKSELRKISNHVLDSTNLSQ